MAAEKRVRVDRDPLPDLGPAPETSAASLSGVSLLPDSRHVLQPQQQRSRNALGKILHAAEILLRTDGLDGFSMAGVSRLSGLPIGNIYRRFKSKGDLVLALRETIAQRDVAAILSRLQPLPSSLEGFIAVFVSAMAETFCSDESIHKVLLTAAGEAHAFNAVAEAEQQRIYEAYREGLQAYLANSDDEDIETLARISFTIIRSGLVSRVTGFSPLASVPWPTVQQHYTAAALGYVIAQQPQLHGQRLTLPQL